MTTMIIVVVIGAVMGITMMLAGMQRMIDAAPKKITHTFTSETNAKTWRDEGLVMFDWED